MPSFSDNTKRGIMYVTFDVEFPRGELTEEQKSIMANILKQESIKKVHLIILFLSKRSKKYVVLLV